MRPSLTRRLQRRSRSEWRWVAVLERMIARGKRVAEGRGGGGRWEYEGRDLKGDWGQGGGSGRGVGSGRVTSSFDGANEHKVRGEGGFTCVPRSYASGYRDARGGVAGGSGGLEGMIARGRTGCRLRRRRDLEGLIAEFEEN